MAHRLAGPHATGSRKLAALTRAALVAFLLLGSASLAGCAGGDSATDELIVTGSTTLLPIAEISGEMFAEENPGTKVLVSGLGSSAGIENVSTGTSDIGTSSRDLKDEEQGLGLVDTPVAKDAIAIIVNRDNPVDELTSAQVRDIFAGRITNWSEVGGEDRPIGLVNRDEASGTREAFFKIVMEEEPFDMSAAVLPGTGQVRSVVAEAPGAVGYISYGFVTENVKVVAVDGVLPSEETILAGTYPVQRTLHFFTKGEPEGLAAEFIEFVLSDVVQGSLVPDAGFTPIGEGAAQ